MNSFSKKCTMFSQYFKENGSFGDLNMAFSAKQHASPTTKNLLPMIERSNPIHQDLNLSPKGGDDNKERSQMTIFYGGKVIVFENFPEEKAKEIMGFASKQNSNTTVLTPSQPDFVAPNIPFLNPLAEGDMPIMRNRSIARFIAKRKDRIRAKAPYQTNGPDASTPKPLDENNKTWLGLAANNHSSSNPNELQFL
ncbi:hypothetical protein Leryth_009169 [Lithospermum erythrorhizon]|nr:hypothetical protein Leryth_009169 [Lithospermum erythrorhizon]